MSLYFVVDTDKYAGNFERDLVAYMTGQVGDCGVGSQNADRFAKEVSEAISDRMEDLVGMEADEKGCYRPAKTFPTPGWFNNGNGGHYRESEPGVEERAIRERDEEHKRYADQTIRRCYASEDYANEEADRYLKESLGQPLSKYPAYQSVAVVLNERPTDEEIEFLKNRARAYDGLTRVSHLDKSISSASIFNIEGFRIVTERTVSDAVSV